MKQDDVRELAELEKSESNLLLCRQQVYHHSPQCKFLSRSTTVQSGPSTMSPEPTTKGRKQSVLWQISLKNATLITCTHLTDESNEKKKKINNADPNNK